MGLRECLVSAADQGQITREEASSLADRFDELHAQARLSLGDEAAAAAAKTRLEAELRFEQAEIRRRTLLADAVRVRVVEHLQRYRDARGNPNVLEAAIALIENYGFSGTSSVAGRQKAIVATVHAELYDVLRAFRRSAIAGRRFNKPLADDVMRELHGQATGVPEAKVFADLLSGTAERLRQRFNAAGGAIPELKDWGWTHRHDARALLTAGREAWTDFIRQRLDVARMRDPLTGESPTPARLDQMLDATWASIVTDGRSARRPSAQAPGRGMLAKQRAEHRFLVFKSADDWLAYDRQFGTGDPVRAWFDHFNMMSRDIAALEVLGPNPGGMVEWLSQVVETETAKAVAGQPSLAAPLPKSAQGALDRIDYGRWRIRSIWDEVRGGDTVAGRVATGFGTARNLGVSALLGSGSITALFTDPLIDLAARRMTGLPQLGALWAVAKTFSKETRETAVRAGIIWDDFLHIMGDEARYAGQLGGSEWSKWLADRTLTLSGLTPITQARRHVFALEFYGALADHIHLSWDQLKRENFNLHQTLWGYGIDRTDWQVLQAAPLYRPKPDSKPILRPTDVIDHATGAGLPRVQQLLGLTALDAETAAAQIQAGVTRTAEKVIEAVLGQTERAVPQGTARARSYVAQPLKAGTVAGEAFRSTLMFKGFALSFTTLQIETVMRQAHQFGAARGAAYAGAMVTGLTLGGVLSLMLRDVINGRDVQNPSDPRFMMQAMQTGGGFGLMGDFLFADQNRFGQGLTETVMGPIWAFGDDAAKLVLGTSQGFFTQDTPGGREGRRPRQALQMARRYTPVMSSHWATRAAWNRVFLDQIQSVVDPDAHRVWREQENRMRRERGTEFWWRPGDLGPSRPPVMAPPRQAR